MRTTFSARVERGRLRGGAWATKPGDLFGAFFLRTNDGVDLRIIMSSGDDELEIPWQHVSVTVVEGKRCPSWEEMCWVKSLFWDEDEVVVQYHPAKMAYVDDHPFCLHLWKPNHLELPVPPPKAVGPGRKHEAAE